MEFMARAVSLTPSRQLYPCQVHSTQSLGFSHVHLRQEFLGTHEGSLLGGPLSSTPREKPSSFPQLVRELASGGRSVEVLTQAGNLRTVKRDSCKLCSVSKTSHDGSLPLRFCSHCISQVLGYLWRILEQLSLILNESSLTLPSISLLGVLHFILFTVVQALELTCLD